LLFRVAFLPLNVRNREISLAQNFKFWTASLDVSSSSASHR
jgi:hypothetical protein